MTNIRDEINKLNLFSPINIENIDWRKMVNISAILCPFIEIQLDRCFFSDQIIFIASENFEDHFMSVQNQNKLINPKFILLTVEIPRLIKKLENLGIRSSWTIFIADEFNSRMRQSIEKHGKKEKTFILESRIKMIDLVRKALSLELKNLSIHTPVKVCLTSEFPDIVKDVDSLSFQLLDDKFRHTFLSGFEAEYSNLLKYWKDRSRSPDRDDFEESILRDQVAYRAVMGEVLRKNQNTVLFSAQPPEPGDFFHGIIKKSVIPTMHVFKNVEGVNKVEEVLDADELRIHLKKFGVITKRKKAHV